jgi:hypothetical protein
LSFTYAVGITSLIEKQNNIKAITEHLVGRSEETALEETKTYTYISLPESRKNQNVES